MRQVQPKVYLIAAPVLDWGQIRAYLKEVGGKSWADRAQNNHDMKQDGEFLVELGGRLCYRSWEPGLNANVTKIREDSGEYLGNILKSGHGSVLEHANYSFILHNVSRILTHEFVRHRAGVAISQESMRFVRLTDLPFWFPKWAQDDHAFMSRALLFLNDAEDFQLWMARHFKIDEGKDFTEKKHITSFMRRFAPSGHATGLLATINIRALRHIVYMRTALGAEEEIRIVCDKIAELASKATPNLMQDYDVNEDQEWVPQWIKV